MQGHPICARRMRNDGCESWESWALGPLGPLGLLGPFVWDDLRFCSATPALGPGT